MIQLINDILGKIKNLKKEFYMKDDEYELHIKETIEGLDKIYGNILLLIDDESDSGLKDYIKLNIENIATCLSCDDRIGLNDILCTDTVQILKLFL